MTENGVSHNNYEVRGDLDMDNYIPVVVIKELSEIDKILPALKANDIPTGGDGSGRVQR